MRKPLTYENALAIARAMPVGGARQPVFCSLPTASCRARYKGNDAFQPQIVRHRRVLRHRGQADMKAGRFFTDSENRHRMAVAVIGEDIYKQLFGEEDAIGKTILVAGHEAGSDRRDESARDGSSRPERYSRHRPVLHHAQDVSHGAGTPADGAGQGRANWLPRSTKCARCSARSAACPSNKPDNFDISTADQMVEQFRSVTSVVALVMVVLSSIGLLVGGIGVMNIMLVSVTERTREIGVRKAIGARRGDIIMQFLTEAVVLTGLGGLIGMLFGWLVSLVTRFFLPNLPTAGAAVGRGAGDRGQRGHRRVLRHLAGQQGRAPGPGGSAALRVAGQVGRHACVRAR